jgi:DNA-binding XRE family transcriptional regulator
MSTFKSAIGLCGLSQQATADFLGVSLDTVKSWCNGRANPPGGVWLQLAGLFRQIESAADGAADVMDLEGVDPRAFNSFEADIVDDALPVEGARNAAGAMALLMTISESAV